MSRPDESNGHTKKRRGSTSHLSAEEEAALSRKLEQANLQHPAADGAAVAPALAASAKSLERNLVSHNLKHRLNERDDVDNLKAHNIVRGDGVAPRLQGAKVQLEQAFTRDQLGHLLECRPEPENLVSRGLIPQAGATPNSVAPSLQAVQKELKHNYTTDRVAHLLEHRSEADALVEQGILEKDATKVAPALQGPQRSLEHNLNRANLYHALKHRPSRSDVEELGYLENDGYGGSGMYADHSLEQQHHQHQQHHAAAAAAAADPAAAGPGVNVGGQPPSSYQRRSKNFHLTRLLLKTVASMSETGELAAQQKAFLKDLIVDQDNAVLALAEVFDIENDLADFKESLVRLASRRP